MGIEARVRSPSFTLVNCLQGRLPVYHIDLYRLADGPHIVDELGWADADDGRAVAIVEWARGELVQDAERTVFVEISYAGQGRALEFHGLVPSEHVRQALMRSAGSGV